MMAFNELILSKEGARVLLTAADIHLLYLQDVKNYKPSEDYEMYTPEEVEQAKEDYDILQCLTFDLKEIIDNYNYNADHGKKGDDTNDEM